MVHHRIRPRYPGIHFLFDRCIPPPLHPLPRPQPALHARSLPTLRQHPAPPALTPDVVERAPQRLAAPSAIPRSSPQPPPRALLPYIPLHSIGRAQPYPKAPRPQPERARRRSQVLARRQLGAGG
jgi:hypothetical protein